MKYRTEWKNIQRVSYPVLLNYALSSVFEILDKAIRVAKTWYDRGGLGQCDRFMLRFLCTAVGMIAASAGALILGTVLGLPGIYLAMLLQYLILSVIYVKQSREAMKA